MDKIKCPLCQEKYSKLNGLYIHLEEEHSDNIPEGYSAQQYLYYTKTGKTHGSCVMCKSDTGWNESTGKYKRFCENPKCKDAYRDLFKKRMVGKYGKESLLNDPEQQRKMLSHRHISGEYEWSDGSKKTYTGSYELDFLKMLDAFMNFDSSDVMTPSPHTYYYMYKGERKFYIPDVFIPSLNLEIEIKDGGDNPNMHHKIQDVDKVKEKLKDDVMNSQKEYDYIKIVNKNYDGFFKYLLDKKKATADAKTISINNIITESFATRLIGSNKKKIDKFKKFMNGLYMSSNTSQTKTVSDDDFRKNFKMPEKYKSDCKALGTKIENDCYNSIKAYASKNITKAKYPKTYDDFKLTRTDYGDFGSVTISEYQNGVNEDKTDDYKSPEWYTYILKTEVERLNEKYKRELNELNMRIHNGDGDEATIYIDLGRITATFYTSPEFIKKYGEISTESLASMPNGYSLRPATKNDTDNMFKWEIESVDVAVRNDPKVIRYITEDVKTSIKDTKMIMYKNKTVGMLTACAIDNGEYWYIGEIYLIPEHRGKGVGSVLLQNEINNHDKIKLQVAYSNTRARELYESLGFRISDKNDEGKLYVMVLDKSSLKESIERLESSEWNDFYHNTDLWESGKSNLLWVTGLSGSGKSTISKEINKEYNAMYVELDNLQRAKMRNWDTTYCPVMDDYINSVGGLTNIFPYCNNLDTISWKDIVKNEDGARKEFSRFFEYMIKSAKTHKDARFVCEGVQIAYYATPDMIKKMSTYPVIIKMNGPLKTEFRRDKRLISHGIDIGDDFFKIFGKVAHRISNWIKGGFYMHDWNELKNYKSSLSEGYADATSECIQGDENCPPHIKDILDSSFIWTATDWHLWDYDKDAKTIYKHKRFDTCLSYYTDHVSDDDVVIYLGDLISDEFMDKESLKNIIKPLPGKKILIKGNNDLFDDKFYYECGFIHVCHKMVWNDILFTHIPEENDYKINIHGHLHGSMKYHNMKYTNQIDVYSDDGMVIPLDTVINSLDEYSSQITEVIEAKENANVVQEGLLTDTRDIDEYYEFDRFVNDESNILIVTGLVSSSKNKIARDIANTFNAEYINLDLFTKDNINTMINGTYLGGASREYVEAIITYANKHIQYNPENPTEVSNPTDDEIIDFCYRIITECRSNTGKKFVITGISIYRYWDAFKSLLETAPIIICKDTVKMSLSNFKLGGENDIYNIMNADSTTNLNSWYKNEYSKIMYMSSDITITRKDLTRIKYNKTVYPVYVTLIDSGRLLGRTIGKITGDTFTHALIGFDPSMRAMYSFGQTLDSHGKVVGVGMTHDDITNTVLSRPVKYELYVTFVSVHDIKKMKRNLYDIQTQKLAYNTPGLIKYALGMNPETKNALFCSEFVATILNTNENITDGLRAAEVRPESFRTMSKFTLVQKGIMTEYNMKETIRRVKQITPRTIR